MGNQTTVTKASMAAALVGLSAIAIKYWTGEEVPTEAVAMGTTLVVGLATWFLPADFPQRV